MVPAWVSRLERFSDRWWYFPFLGLLAGADFFVVFIPADGLLISAVLLTPARWVRAAVCFTLGSTLGGMIFAWLVDVYGMGILTSLAPSLETSSMWMRATEWIDAYGLWALAGWLALPIVQQPPVAIVALGHASLGGILAAMLAGRALKYGVFAWLASHAPDKLLRLKSVRKEIEEVPHPPIPGEERKRDEDRHGR